MAKKPNPNDEPEAFDPDSMDIVPADDPMSLTVAGVALPDWMVDEEKTGTEDLGKYQATPRIGLVQAQASAEKKDEHGEGSVVIFPDGLKVAQKNEPFVVVPIIFFATWEKWSDYRDQNSDFVLESTGDETSELARRAKSKLDRRERYPDSNPNDPMFFRYVENLNFVVMIDSGPAKGEFATITFNNSDHFLGERIAGMLRRRPVSIFANRLELTSYLRPPKNNQQWYSFKVNNPTPEMGGPIVSDKAQYAKLAQIHKDFRPMVEQNKVRVHRDDETGTPDAEPVEASADIERLI